MKNFFILYFIVTLSVGCASTNHGQITPGYMPAQTADQSSRDLDEINIGQQIHQSVLERSFVYRDVKLNQYVEDIGYKLASFAPRQNLRYEFTVLLDKRIYIGHAPGGFVYITTGMIKRLENEIELAAALAHEISRLQYYYREFSPVKKMVQTLGPISQLAGLAFPPAAVLAPVGLMAMDAYFLQEKTVDERTFDADAMSMELMLKSDYDPQGIIDFLYKVSSVQGKDLPLILNYLSSHPLSEERVSYIYKVYLSLDLSNRTFYTHWDRYRDMTASVRDLR